MLVTTLRKLLGLVCCAIALLSVSRRMRARMSGGVRERENGG